MIYTQQCFESKCTSLSRWVHVVCGRPGNNHHLFLCGRERPYSLCTTTLYVDVHACADGSGDNGVVCHLLSWGSALGRSVWDEAEWKDVLVVSCCDSPQSAALLRCI